MIGPGLPEFAAWAEARLPRLIDNAYAAIVARIPLYRTDDVVTHDDLRRSVEQNLRFVISRVAEPRTTHDLAALCETGRRRAHQGVPLPEALHAYRIAFAALCDALVDHARHSARPGTGDVLLDGARMIWHLADEHVQALTEGYRAAIVEPRAVHRRCRPSLVDAVFTGEPRPEADPWEAAKFLGLPPDASLAAVAAETRGVARERLADFEPRLAARGIVSVWRLTPALLEGVVSMPAERRDTALAVLRDVVCTRTGVSPLYLVLTDTPRALHLARMALAGLPPGRPGVRMFSSSPLAALIACELDEGRRLAEQVLGSVLALPAADRATLLGSLHVFLDQAGSVDRSAEVLRCHPNTVRNRLRRLRELTGRALSDPRGLAELATAAYALRLSHEPRRPHGGGVHSLSTRRVRCRPTVTPASIWGFIRNWLTIAGSAEIRRAKPSAARSQIGAVTRSG